MSTHATSLSVIVPTYQEVENLPFLIERLSAERERHAWQLEVLLMDDDSRDGSAALVEKLGLPWLKLITRSGERGLSQAVLEGLRMASGEVLVVMDADLSHPPEAIAAMLTKLEAGADFVVGSRFVDGGTTDDDWGVFRWANSRIATMLAWPLATIADPMSGFFMLRRSTFAAHSDYNPIGYKIGLELLVKCNCRNAEEVPIHFADRQHGHSKLTLAEQLRYIEHVRRLYSHRFAFWTQLVHFLAVGASGLLVNLAILTALLALHVLPKLAVLMAIVLSMLWNFTWNRRYSFVGANQEPLLRQLWDFASACSIGAAVNYAVTISVTRAVGNVQLAAVIGVVAATGFNFAASRLYVFKRRHVRKR